MEFKVENLSATNVYGENIIYDTALKTIMSLWHRHDDTNEIHTYDAYADSAIGQEAIRVDGNLVFVATWGEGFAIFRVEDNGTITNIYNDNYIGDDIGAYNHWTSCAVDPVDKVAYIGSNNKDGIVRINYSDLNNIYEMSTMTEASHGLYADQAGMSYTTSLQVAGDYLYYGAEERQLTQWGIPRVNLRTQTHEWITIQNPEEKLQYAAVYYDEDLDRIYEHSYYYYGMVVVENASTTYAKAYTIDMHISGINDYGYVHLDVADPEHPNHIWMGDSDRWFQLDISACVVDGVAAGTNPTIIKGPFDKNSAEAMILTNVRFGWSTPDKGNYIFVLGDRGWNRQGGWLDQETGNIVSVSRWTSSDNCYRARDYLYYDYAPMPRLVTASNGTKYWFMGGYSWDGHKNRTYAEGDAVYLSTSGHATFGSFQLDSGNNIGELYVINLKDMLYTPAGTSFSVVVSNNNGATWESFDIESESHIFSSTGDTVLIKFIFSGNGIASSYILGKNKLMAIMVEDSNTEYSAEEVKNIKHVFKKLRAFKIRGGR